jgi:signal transduction histidine kinase
MRDRLQALVDRVFFRTPYDPGHVLAAVGIEIGSALKVDEIARIVRRCVDETIPNGCTGLFVRAREDGVLGEAGGLGTLPPALATQLEDGRLLTAYDAPQLYASPAVHAAVRAGLKILDAELAVPLQLGGKLVGALTVGHKRSGLFYTAGDTAFLSALAHQAAIALQNAESYEALAELNAQLEGRVRERTAQLVQSERLASLGRLVAGVAHEINNPVSFVATSIVPLRERLADLAAVVPAADQPALREADELVDIMARGAERTVAIVKDLRAFSRLGEEARKPTDLHEGLDVTLRLLETRWRDRITIERDYGDLPRVECNAGQVNQVFMNLLANACDAIPGRGTIRITTRVDGDVVRIAIQDDGSGIAPDVLPHIFDPFFTTKDVGAGTGLGLSISHGVVTAHGGRIEVRTAPQQGTTFEVILPVGGDAIASSLDSVASRGR